MDLESLSDSRPRGGGVPGLDEEKPRDRELGSILGIAYLLPLLGVYLVAMSLFSAGRESDEGSYVRFAENITNGFYTRGGDEVDLWFGPGLPLLVAPFMAVDLSLTVIRAILGPIVLFAAVGLFFLVLRERVGDRLALASAVGLGLYLPFLPLLPSLHSEILAVLCIVVFMWAIARNTRQPSALTFVAAAGALAMLAITRVVFGWVLLACAVACLAVWLIRRRSVLLRTGLVFTVALAFCLPWLGLTYVKSGNIFYWASSGGLSLYWMSVPLDGNLGTWHSTSDVFSRRELAPVRLHFSELRQLNQVEADERLRERAIDQIIGNPSNYAKNVAANVSRMWFNFPYGFTPQKLSTALYTLPNAILLGSLAVVLALMIVRRQALPPESWAFGALLVTGVAVQSMLAAYARMLTPLVPLMIWFIAISISVIAARTHRPLEHESPGMASGSPGSGQLP